MDPDALLATVRACVGAIIDGEESAASAGEELADRFRDLDEWITKGGFLPSDWEPTERRQKW